MLWEAQPQVIGNILLLTPKCNFLVREGGGTLALLTHTPFARVFFRSFCGFFVVCRREGIAMGLFRGMGATMLREPIQFAIYYPVVSEPLRAWVRA